MSTTRQPTLTATGEQRRAEIIEAAAYLFNELGFHNTSTAAIADRVGTAKATVYHYFKAKHEILYEIHDLWIDGLITLFETRTRETENTEAILHSVFRDLLFLMHSKPGHVRVFFEYFRELPPDLQIAARIKRDRYEELVEATISKGMLEGLIVSQDPRTASFALFGMCNWTYQWYRPGGRLGHVEVADQLYEIFMSGIQVLPK